MGGPSGFDVFLRLSSRMFSHHSEDLVMQRTALLILLIVFVVCVAGGEFGWGFVRPRWHFAGRRNTGWARLYSDGDSRGNADIESEGP
ncbi:hypothetical protein RB195_015128 [Necator americanus]|uniref:Uncharacterized protein n=1 Tax=Necator americanus TaxID=51031 RepID=A0ABR1E355_NECAM